MESGEPQIKSKQASKRNWTLSILSLSYLEEIGFYPITAPLPTVFAVAIRLIIALLAMLCYYYVALLLSKYSSQTIKIQFYIFN